MVGGFTVSCLLLLLSLSSVQAFTPAHHQHRTLLSPLTAEADDTAAAATAEGAVEAPVELPRTYVRCGKCQSCYPFTTDDLEGKNARRLECSVCGHSWFQSKDRIMNFEDGYEIIPLPQRDMDRIKLNLDEGKPPSYYGEKKLYVGNISFQCVEDDMYELFGSAGIVGDVSLVRDDEGRIRGFGFVTMRTAEGAEKAIAELHGASFRGRDIAVRPSTT